MEASTCCSVDEQLLKRTTSLCPVCHAACPGEVWRTDGPDAKVFLRRTCPAHGEAEACISSDARFYWLAKGDPRNSESGDCCGGNACRASDGAVRGTLGRNANGKGNAPFEKLSTCLALIEIVNSCNLACPTCYADSPVGAGKNVDAVPLADLQRRIQSVIDRKGGIEILQLSGGEPTLHPQFFQLLAWARANPGIDYLLLNTNGVRIANDRAFTDELTRSFDYGGLQLYLQFDGVQLEGQHFLRGADLRDTRRRAIERCAEMNLPITLAMTVTPENLPHLWDAIEFGLQYPHVRGVAFQPMFGSGRVPLNGSARLNTADIILAAVAQSGDRLRFEDFTPLPWFACCALHEASRLAILTLAISHAAVQLLKRTAIRGRPSTNAQVTAVVREPDRFSFPSGHATASMALALSYGLSYPMLAGPLLMIALGVGFSRIRLGVHYPSDVVAGQLIAAATTAALVF